MASAARVVAAALFIVALSSPSSAEAAAAADPAGPASATVPVTLDHNRMVVEVELVRPDGRTRTARAWVDTGGTAVILAEPLARELGIDAAAGGEHSADSGIPVPPMRLGGLPLDTQGMTALVRAGRFARPGVQAECTLPPRCLRRLHVVLDYPRRRLTVARPGVLRPQGARVPCRVNPDTGLFMIDATIDGRVVPLGVDNGSAGTWVSETLTAAWKSAHPDWPQVTGAAGSANFFGLPFETRGALMELPAVTVGALRTGRVAVLGVSQDMFDWYSKKSAGAVLGFIGANVIGRFRLEIDFPNQVTYWEAGPAAVPNDLDIVGLSIRPEPDGRYTIAGVVTRDGRPMVEGVQAGDVLMKVDGLECTNAPMGTVIGALRGTPGATRTLVVERAGALVTIRTTVVRLP